MSRSIALATLSLSAAHSFVIPAVVPAPVRSNVRMMADIGDSGVSFENVAREWRCKYTPGESGGPGDSASLKACNDLLMEYMPKLKALPGCHASGRNPVHAHRFARLSCSLCQSLLTAPIAWDTLACGSAEVTRQVCGGCMDFKVSITQPLEEHGEWAGADYNPLCPREGSNQHSARPLGLSDHERACIPQGGGVHDKAQGDRGHFAA